MKEILSEIKDYLWPIFWMIVFMLWLGLGENAQEPPPEPNPHITWGSDCA